MTKGNFKSDKKHMLKNPPKHINSGQWVECVIPTSTITKGKKYKVRGHHCYLNHYGAKGDRYCMWDEFITIKNDYNYTVKVNLIKFNLCKRPESSYTEIERLKKRIEKLESKHND